MKKFKIATLALAGALATAPLLSGCGGEDTYDDPINYSDCTAYVVLKESDICYSLHIGTNGSKTLCGMRNGYFGASMVQLGNYATYDINNPNTYLKNVEWFHYGSMPVSSAYTSVCERCKNLIPDDATELRLD